MNGSNTARRLRRWSLARLAGVVICVTLIAPLAMVDGDWLRGPLVGYLAKHAGRSIRIDGPLRAHLLSLHPSLVAERVTVGNPAWTAPGVMAEIDKLTLVLNLPLFGQSFAIQRLELKGADLHLMRDAEGHANWHWKAPGILPGRGLPVIHELTASFARVALADDRHHMSFNGSVTAEGAAKSLRIIAHGALNGRDVTIEVEGEPLVSVARAKPFHFTFDERSSGSHLTGRGVVLEPFDFRGLDGTFDASGADLKDLYFLIGVHLPDSSSYRLSGNFVRRDTSFQVNHLVVTSGQSDLHATLMSRMDSNGRSHIDADLYSQRLRLADLGEKAAGRAPQTPAVKPALLPDKEIQLQGLRRSDCSVDFHAHELDIGALSLHTVAGKMTIDHGVLAVPVLSATLPEGKVSMHGKIDAKTDVPNVYMHVDAANVQVAQFFHKDPAQLPLEGMLHGHLSLTSRGHSVHDLAANASGVVTVTLAQGAIRASIAELIGIDLRGVGLLLTHNKEDTQVRCAVANFQGRDGILTARTLVLDTDAVAITGNGTIRLDSQTLDLQFQGHPKHLRLFRLRAPVSVRGSLAHPQFSIDKENRKLQLIDPGHAQDVDCPALLMEAETGDLHTGSP